MYLFTFLLYENDIIFLNSLKRYQNVYIYINDLFVSKNINLSNKSIS